MPRVINGPLGYVSASHLIMRHNRHSIKCSVGATFLAALAWAVNADGGGISESSGAFEEAADLRSQNLVSVEGVAQQLP